MSVAEARAAAPRERWTPARIFMVVAGLYHLPLGIVGLIVDRTFPVGAAAAERADSRLVFGLFETNGWHSLAALILGIIAIFFTIYPRRAREVALAMGLFHVGIVVSLIVWPPSTFWLASNVADQVIHTFTAIGGIGSALLTRPQEQEAPVPHS